jgi:pre-mRNA-splicing factor CDC5/CEF1
VLIKSLHDIYNQIESKHVENKTFEKIREREVESIDKRSELLLQDVLGQTDREKQLQNKFRQLCLERDALLAAN